MLTFHVSLSLETRTHPLLVTFRTPSWVISYDPTSAKYKLGWWLISLSIGYCHNPISVIYKLGWWLISLGFPSPYKPFVGVSSALGLMAWYELSMGLVRIMIPIALKSFNVSLHLTCSVEDRTHSTSSQIFRSLSSTPLVVEHHRAPYDMLLLKYLLLRLVCQGILYCLWTFSISCVMIDKALHVLYSSRPHSNPPLC